MATKQYTPYLNGILALYQLEEEFLEAMTAAGQEANTHPPQKPFKGTIFHPMS